MGFLELHGITKRFEVRQGWFGSDRREVEAVRGVSLEIAKGEVLGLVGESGCGKTTLSRIVMQLLAPSAGRVILEGEDLAGLDRDGVRRKRIDFQMIFQDPYASLNPRMTVYSTLAEAVSQRHPGLSEEELRGRVSELMEKTGLAPRLMRKYPHEFSGGQRQRIAIARALAPEPKLVIADEPVSALDVSIQSQILNLLRGLQRELGLTMVFISHDLAVVHYIADRIAVMQSGEIVEIGAASRVFHEPEHPYTRQLLAAIPRVKPGDSRNSEAEGA